MGFWGVASLFFAVLYLAYRRPSTMWKILPQWLQDSCPSEEVTSATAVDCPTLEEVPVRKSSPVRGEKESTDSTPKALPVTPQTDVPTFSLTCQDGERVDPRNMVAPSVAKANSAQRANNMPPPPQPQKSDVPSFPAANSAQRAGGASFAPVPTAGLMAPPTRLDTAHRAPVPSAIASLRVQSTGPLPNRGPPTNSQQRANGGLAPNRAVSTPNGRGKVLLAPGHSPMDWAALTKSGNISGVTTFQRVTPSQLRAMTGRKGKPAWSSWQGKVYNITPYLPFHPGGESELMKAAGRDGEKLFMDVHPWVNWENMMGSCLVGVMVSEDYARSELEDMD